MNAASIMASLVLVVGVPLNAYVTFKLFRLLRQAGPVKPRLLRERLIVAGCVLLNVTTYALVFWNNDTIPPILGLDVTKVVTRFAALVVALVPACYWLWIYRAD